MGNMQATPRNRIVGDLADILKSGKSAMDQYEMKPWVPLVGGTGLGEMFMGKAPELMDDVSYNGLQAAMRGGNLATGGIGTYGARPAVADAALLGADALGIGKGIGVLTKAGGRAAGNALMGGTTELGRREFMKKAAALSAAAAATGGGAGMLRKLGKETGEVIANTIPKVADNVAATATKYKYNSLADYLEHQLYRATEEANIANAEVGFGMSDDVIDELSQTLMKKQLKQDASSYDTHKHHAKTYNNTDRNLNNLQTRLRDKANTYLEENSFSPEAKAQMNNLKNDWPDYANQYGHNPDWTEGALDRAMSGFNSGGY